MRSSTFFSLCVFFWAMIIISLNMFFVCVAGGDGELAGTGRFKRIYAKTTTRPADLSGKDLYFFLNQRDGHWPFSLSSSGCWERERERWWWLAKKAEAGRKGSPSLVLGCVLSPF